MKKERNSTESYLLTWKEATKIINNWCILSHVKWELKEKEIKNGSIWTYWEEGLYRRLCSTEDPRACLSLSIIANSVIGNYVQYVNNRIQSIQGHKTTILVTEYDAGKRDCRTTHVWEMIPFSSSTWWEELSLSNNTVINWSVIRVTASFSRGIGGRL